MSNKGGKPDGNKNNNSNNNSNNNNKTDTDPNDGDGTIKADNKTSTGKWFDGFGSKLKGPAKVLGVIALVITGIYFLPSLFVKSTGNALFPFLPEEYRPIAVAGSSCCSCCSICISALLALMLVVMK